MNICKMLRNGAPLALLLILTACAIRPQDVAPTAVSTLKYADYDCRQIAQEINDISKKAGDLYEELTKERRQDNWQASLGFLVLPLLLLGGDDEATEEYAHLKGEYEALRANAVEKKCSIAALSPDEILEKRSRR